MARILLRGDMLDLIICDRWQCHVPQTLPASELSWEAIPIRDCDHARRILGFGSELLLKLRSALASDDGSEVWRLSDAGVIEKVAEKLTLGWWIVYGKTKAAQKPPAPHTPAKRSSESTSNNTSATFNARKQPRPLLGSSPLIKSVAEKTTAARPDHWIEIELVGEDKRPIAREAYRIVLPDGSCVEGFLDESGFVRLENLKHGGTCRITFPRLDGGAWEHLETMPARSPEQSAS